MFNLILFGPPGSGKGTQSDLLIKNYGFFHLSTGALLREEVSKKTALGIEAQKYIDEGQLVPDEVVIGMIDSKLNEHPEVEGIIFDGFPRTKKQAEALDKLLELRNNKINILLSLEVPEEELETRLLERGKALGRSDDTKETIEKRIIEYKKKTHAVADYYNRQGKLEPVNGVGSISEIFDAIQKKLDVFISPLA